MTRISAKRRVAIGDGGMNRDNSSRSPAMVRIRNASHHATISCTAEPSAHAALPMAQHSAPSPSVKVNSARCRRQTSIDAATNPRLAARNSHGASDAAPVSAAMPPNPAQSGAAYAQRRPIATARSSAMTTPKKPQIINGPCSAEAPAANAGTVQPSRARPAPAPATRPTKPRISSGTRHSGGSPEGVTSGGFTPSRNAPWRSRSSCQGSTAGPRPVARRRQRQGRQSPRPRCAPDR